DLDLRVLRLERLLVAREVGVDHVRAVGQDEQIAGDLRGLPVRGVGGLVVCGAAAPGGEGRNGHQGGGGEGSRGPSLREHRRSSLSRSTSLRRGGYPASPERLAPFPAILSLPN